ncbi:Zuotin [Coemansia nantahalensis]|nr:Zuotin [Coemansia nantahalensis]
MYVAALAVGVLSLKKNRAERKPFNPLLGETYEMVDPRYMDAKNRKQRATLKTEDNQRLRALVDAALAADPRMARFRDEDKKKRNARRNAREEEDRKAKDAQRRAEEDAKQAAASAAVQEEEDKKRRQDAHKLFKKEQRSLKVLFKSANYFAAGASAADIAAATAKLDQILAAKTDADGLIAARTAIEAAHAAGTGAAAVDALVAEL